MAKKAMIKKIFKTVWRGVLFASFLFFGSSLFYTLYLKWFPPVTTPLMVMRAFEPRSDVEGKTNIRSEWCRFDDISDNAKVAVIAEEDQNFANHDGFDFEAIEKAMKHNSKSKTVRGASTISQQVAKNIFLWNSRSWIRKGLEVYFTFLIENIWGKERILQMYLNVAELGDGVFGVGAASQIYFHKPASDISASQAALLAAVLPNPRLYKANNPSPYIVKRQGRVLHAMQKIGGSNYLDNF